jgi:hypothetical protein
MEAASVQNAMTRSYYNTLGGSDDPFVWFSLFKLVQIPWKWWQGWHLEVHTDYVYPEDYDEWSVAHPKKKKSLKLRKPPRTERVEGRGRTRTQAHLIPGAHESVQFDAVTMTVTAGVYVAFGVRANEHDDLPLHISALPNTIMVSESGSSITITPEFRTS